MAFVVKTIQWSPLGGLGRPRAGISFRLLAIRRNSTGSPRSTRSARWNKRTKRSKLTMWREIERHLISNCSIIHSICASTRTIDIGSCNIHCVDRVIKDNPSYQSTARKVANAGGIVGEAVPRKVYCGLGRERDEEVESDRLGQHWQNQVLMPVSPALLTLSSSRPDEVVVSHLPFSHCYFDPSFSHACCWSQKRLGRLPEQA